MEIWKQIPGYEGYYEASHLGRIRSVDRIITVQTTRWGAPRLIEKRLRGQIIQPVIGPHGYYQLVLCVDGVEHTELVHDLVLTTFIGPRPDGMDACHGPGGSLDNFIGLSWGSKSKNNKEDKHRDGMTNWNVGERNGKAKLTSEQVVLCRAQHNWGDVSDAALAKQYGVSYSTMIQAVNGTSYKELPMPLPAEKKSSVLQRVSVTAASAWRTFHHPAHQK
jgi:hypothetical protein